MAERKHSVSRSVEVGGTTVATGVGSMLGAAKLRDEFKRDYPAHFERGAATATQHADAIAPKAGRLARLVSEGRPGFIPLAVGTAGGLSAAGARHYRKRHPVQTDKTLVKSAFGIVHKADKQPKPLAAMDTIDGKIRKLKRKNAPSATQLIARAGDEGLAVIGVEPKLSKAADPVRAEHRRRKAVEYGAGAGAVGAGVGSVRADRAGRGHLKAANKAARVRDSAFASAGMHSAQTNADLHRYAEAVKRKHGKGVTGAALADAATAQGAAHRHIGVGIAAHHRAGYSSLRAEETLRGARHLRLAAVGLGAGAVLAHRHASRDR